jgi:S1-C subfamily serine protease
MWGFNWVDLVLLCLLILAAIEGARIGILTQLFGFSAFFGILFSAGWLFPHLLLVHNANLRAFMNATLVLVAAACGGMYGLSVGEDIHWSLRIGKRMYKRNYKWAESWLGIFTGVTACLFAIWLLGVGVSRLPFEGLSNSASDSRIIQQVADHLPPVPAVFAEFNRQFDPNSQPYVSAQPKPNPSFEYSAAGYAVAKNKATASVVRITSFGCGGLVSGSGFIIAPNLVATNAHVIAGVKRPIVKHGRSSYAGVPIYFDAELDLAILRVNHLNGPSLSIDTAITKNNVTVTIIGYPGGNYEAIPGIIRQNLTTTSGNIYNQGSSSSNDYGIQATIEDGSSGSPVVLPDGQVVGIIFSRSLSASNYAYALSSIYIESALAQSATSYQRVGNGSCVL